MTDKDSVSIDSVRAAYALLGLDRADFDRTSKVEIDPHRVKVTRRRLDDHGHTMVADGNLLLDTAEIKIYRGSSHEAAQS